MNTEQKSHVDKKASGVHLLLQRAAIFHSGATSFVDTTNKKSKMHSCQSNLWLGFFSFFTRTKVVTNLWLVFLAHFLSEVFPRSGH